MEFEMMILTISFAGIISYLRMCDIIQKIATCQWHESARFSNQRFAGRFPSDTGSRRSNVGVDLAISTGARLWHSTQNCILSQRVIHKSNCDQENMVLRFVQMFICRHNEGIMMAKITAPGDARAIASPDNLIRYFEKGLGGVHHWMLVRQILDMNSVGPLACVAREEQKCAGITEVSQLEWHSPDARDAIQVSLTATISMLCETLPWFTSDPGLSGGFCGLLLRNIATDFHQSREIGEKTQFFIEILFLRCGRCQAPATILAPWTA
jgi:hypothetical protein